MINFREAAEKFITGALNKLSFVKKYIPARAAAVIIVVLAASAALFTGIRIIPLIFKSDNVYEAEKSDKDDLLEIDIDISDFIIPEEFRSLEEFKWVPYRGVKEKWSDEDIAEFWISPEETVRKAAEEKNEKHIKELFESVP